MEDTRLPNRGLLRAVLVAFTLLLAYRFVAAVAATVLLLATGAIQQVESNLLAPLVVEKAASVHPVVVMASMTVMGAAFGVLGALLVVPASVVTGVLVQERWFERPEKKDAVGGGRNVFRSTSP